MFIKTIVHKIYTFDYKDSVVLITFESGSDCDTCLIH